MVSCEVSKRRCAVGGRTCAKTREVSGANEVRQHQCNICSHAFPQRGIVPSRMQMPPPVIVLDEAGPNSNLFKRDVDGLDNRRGIVAEHDPEAFPQQHGNPNIHWCGLHGSREVMVGHESAELTRGSQQVIGRADPGCGVQKVNEHPQVGTNIIGQQHDVKIPWTASTVL